MGRKRNRSHLILMELMLVLFFFAVCGAILLQVFVKSHNTSVKAKELTETKTYVTQAAEIFEAGCLEFEQYQEYFPKLEQDEAGYKVYFNKNWNMTTKENAVYKMTIRLTRDGMNAKARITMTKGKKQIYHLDLLKHFPGRKSNERS